MNRSPPPVPQTIKYGVDAPPRPPFVPKSDDPENAKGTPDRSRKPHQPESDIPTPYGDRVLINSLAPDRPDIAQHALQYPLMDESPKRDRTEEKEATDRDSRQLNEVPRLRPPKDHKRDGRQSISPLNKSMPPPGSVDTKHESVSPRQPPIRPSLGAPARRPSIEQPQWSPPFRSSTQTSPDAQPRVSLPSLGSPSSSCGPSPDTGSGSGSGSGSKQVLPSIHSALSALANDFPPPRPNGLPPPYPYPGSATSRNDSPHDRQLPQLLSHQIPPSPFSHFSPASTKDVSNNPSPATQPSLWQRTPIPPSSESHPPATPFDASPMTAKSPATSYPTPTEQVAPTAGSDHFSLSQASCNGATMGGNYKCTHPGCTAPPFQTQYLLK